MLAEILEHLNNYFIVPDGKHVGEFEISNGGIALSFLEENQYYRIVGSMFNDGVYKYAVAEDTLTDEAFNGVVWALAVPPAVIALAAEITAWQTANPESAYTSESFGGYSYSKAAGASWADVFRRRLNQWRKI